jgi:hypothetical protein
MKRARELASGAADASAKKCSGKVLGAVAERLRAARALIEPPSAWTQGAEARDQSGAEVAPAEPSAVAWSIDGALWRVTGDAPVYVRRAAHVAFAAAAEVPIAPDAQRLSADPAARFGYLSRPDGRRAKKAHGAMLRLFDRAIALARGGDHPRS